MHEEGPLARLEEHLQRLELTIQAVPLDDELFKHLPETGPPGAEDSRRSGGGSGLQVHPRGERVEARGRGRPKQVAMTYEKFQYPVAGVRGTVKRTTTHAGPPSTDHRPGRYGRRATHHHQGERDRRRRRPRHQRPRHRRERAHRRVAVRGLPGRSTPRWSAEVPCGRARRFRGRDRAATRA